MTIVIYDYHELQERASQHLRAWKVWQTILYILTAIFGILNYTFLIETENLVGNRCLFYPQELAFHWVELPNATVQTNLVQNYTDIDNKTDAHTKFGLPNVTDDNISSKNDVNETTLAQTTPVPVTEAAKMKREALQDNVTIEVKTTVEDSNATIITANKTHRYMLNVDRTLFPSDTDAKCQFGEYMPLLSATFAIVWATLFIMCPNGGRTRTGLRQPWRILTPAFIFAFVMVILTGISFTDTNGGLQAFCAAFENYTNATTCSAVNPLLESSWNATWGVGERIAATRAAAAGVWAGWACVCALLLARCLTAADFEVKRTSVQIKDPMKKVTPYLEKQKSDRRSNRSSSPGKRDTVSVQSEPTATTELVTATVEHEVDSQPTSLITTPEKDKPGEQLEMTRIDDEESRDRI